MNYSTVEARVKQAREIVEHAERDLRRILTEGERRDLLKDNTSWSSSDVACFVTLLQMRGLR